MHNAYIPLSLLLISITIFSADSRLQLHSVTETAHSHHAQFSNPINTELKPMVNSGSKIMFQLDAFAWPIGSAERNITQLNIALDADSSYFNLLYKVTNIFRNYRPLILLAIPTAPDNILYLYEIGEENRLLGEAKVQNNKLLKHSGDKITIPGAWTHILPPLTCEKYIYANYYETRILRDLKRLDPSCPPIDVNSYLSLTPPLTCEKYVYAKYYETSILSDIERLDISRPIDVSLSLTPTNDDIFIFPIKVSIQSLGTEKCHVVELGILVNRFTLYDNLIDAIREKLNDDKVMVRLMIPSSMQKIMYIWSDYGSELNKEALFKNQLLTRENYKVIIPQARAQVLAPASCKDHLSIKQYCGVLRKKLRKFSTT